MIWSLNSFHATPRLMRTHKANNLDSNQLLLRTELPLKLPSLQLIFLLSTHRRRGISFTLLHALSHPLYIDRLIWRGSQHLSNQRRFSVVVIPL
jgi:hypothetical protein